VIQTNMNGNSLAHPASLWIKIAPNESLEERDFYCQEKLIEWGS
jgi:hypothetical protein